MTTAEKNDKRADEKSDKRPDDAAERKEVLSDADLAEAFIDELAAAMKRHKRKMSDDMEESTQVEEVLEAASTTVSDHENDHANKVKTVLAHWKGKAADEFESNTKKLSKDLTGAAEDSSAAAKIVRNATESLVGGKAATQRLIDEFRMKAKKILLGDEKRPGDVEVQMIRKDDPIEAVRRLADEYTEESEKNLRKVEGELESSAKKLKELETVVKSDEKDSGGGDDDDKGGGETTKASYTVVSGDSLWKIAQSHLPPGASAGEVDKAWRQLYDANKGTIGKNPNLIYPGQKFTIPGSWKSSKKDDGEKDTKG